MDYRVIKENDLFLLTDENGNIPEDHPYGPGLYTKDTRFLSKFDLKINGEDPILLSSEADKTYYAEMLLTNPHMEEEGDVKLWRESVELKRKRFIYGGALYESLRVKNYNPKQTSFEISLHLDADFKDMFLVRGFQSGKVGKKLETVINDTGLAIQYLGADEVTRKLDVKWDAVPDRITEKGDVHFSFTLDHGEEKTVSLTMVPEVDGDTPEQLDYKEAFQRLKDSYKEWEESSAKVSTNHSQLQRLIDRGLSDLRVLLTDLGHGKFPVAGLPWFGVPFGRDSLIAALQMLPFNPEVAKGTLRTMASQQGTKKDSWRDEEPGKIMHEIRFGELANTGQIPFTPYYGTIDATPLFLVLLSEYIKWTGDFELFHELEVNAGEALNWIDHYGDRDGDGFVEYHQESSKGIANQGWKDSGDSIVHRNGDYAETPIALSEVQGYVYHAKESMADIYKQLGFNEKADKLLREAADLKERFETSFWMEDQQFYALALDKEKNQVGTVTSNPGHVLFSGMLDEAKAKSVSDMLVSDKMYTGYGIRTMGTGEAGYNPMSYHNGTVWPHDNSYIILGMSKTNNRKQAAKAMEGLIRSADSFEYDRLPELFCGYEANGKAVKYPVACSPQAWAAGTPLLFVQSMLGLFPDAMKQTVRINPYLPDGVNDLKVENMKIGNGVLSLLVKKADDTHEIDIIENTTGFKVVSR
ncbi:amylo-alpha-1,6-glucosidase [Salipaludibacillus aurantiacus]|uniref:Glycogen debranching enzyme (Alpha-1,6-glucosidase) n=1 Tax=Salipaludibacillus aurantiacus TaxID=1601833 RepID=A0A1H9VX46_9BACI|nr:amylo-alpha-1,6-glucosidase [Salipaludibacillus aurantiacus]SES26235.1 Glycogen debranching enzyme (alpha-1,6-glucosidase) [Salipaludibacillus aurantiacus]